MVLRCCSWVSGRSWSGVVGCVAIRFFVLLFGGVEFLDCDFEYY